MLRRIFTTLIMILLILSMVVPGFAQEITQVGNVVPFNLLGFTEEVLYGPFDTVTYSFSLPANWDLTQAAELELSYRVYTAGDDIIATNQNDELVILDTIDGAIDIEFNGELIDVIPLEKSSEWIADVTIPLSALQEIEPGERHELVIDLDAGATCDEFDLRTRVAIHADSQISFPHTVGTPVTNLALLPRPIYQRSFIPDQAIFVIPDAPSQAEFQAAMTVASGFGTMTGGNLINSLKTASQVGTVELNENHVVLIGKPSSLPLIGQVSLPVPVTAAGFDSTGAQAEDGLVQMAVSPWNNANVALVVTGNSDLGVMKAAAAVSTGEILPAEGGDYAIIADVNPQIPAVDLKLDQTFADLGYEDRKISRVGYSALEYRFYLPPGLTLDNDAYLDLMFSHSKLLNYDLSGLIVQVNGKDVGSVRFSDDTADNHRLRMQIPSLAVFPGFNRLRINSQLIPQNYCIDPRLASTWVRIWPESTLHLPTIQRFVVSPFEFDLDLYPAPFALDPLLSSTALVVPANDPAAWNIASQVAFNLGDRTDPALSNLVAYFADSVPGDVLTSRDVLMIGVPSSLPLLAEVNSLLPAPVDLTNNTLTKNVLQVDYRLPAGTSAGYLELATSPWNNEKIVITALGSNTAGVEMAGAALINGSGLGGNFALVVNEQVAAADTRIANDVIPAIAVEEEAPEAVPQFEYTEADVPEKARPAWVLPVMGGVIALMLLIVIIAASSNLRRRRR